MTERRHIIRSEVKELVLLAGPVVAMQLGQISNGFIDVVMVGRLGPDALAGVALGNSTFFFFLLVCLGVVIAVGPMVSQAYGAGDYDPIGRSVRQGLWLGVALTIPVFLMLWNVAPIWRLMQQDEQTILLAQDYLRAIVWGFLPFLWFIALRSFVEAVSRPWPVTFIILLGVVARHLFGGELVRAWERLLSRVPVARNIYGGVKQLFEAIFRSDQTSRFNRVILIEYPRKGVYALAFTTGPARGPLDQPRDRSARRWAKRPMSGRTRTDCGAKR